MRGWVEQYRGGFRGRVLEDSGTKRSSIVYEKKKEAQAWLEGELVDRRRGKKVDLYDDGATYGDWADRWLIEKSPTWKPKTQASYESLMRSLVLPTFADSRMSKLTLREGREWLAQLHDRGLSSSRIRQAVITLRGPIRYALEEEAIARDPFTVLEAPKQVTTREYRFLTLPQLVELRDVAGFYAPLIWTLGLTGMRFAEAAGLRVDRVNFLRRRITIDETLSEVGGHLHVVPPKSGKARTITVPSSVIEMMAGLEYHQDGYVFTSLQGGVLRYSNFYRNVWRPMTAEIGLDGLVVHDLRRTAGSLLIAEGAHPREVQEYLGHASIETTMKVYGHVFPDRNAELATRLDEAIAAVGA